MKRARRPLILLLAVLATGAARLPLEARLTRTLKEQGLLPVPLGVTTREKIGQTSAVVALGGLRTLVATFLNLRAFDFFTQQRWGDVDETFQLIVDLAPRTRYYWETGSWHQAYNAAAYFLYDSDLPPLRQREAWRASILRGRQFLERGIRNNPGEWSLYANLGFLLSDAKRRRPARRGRLSHGRGSTRWPARRGASRRRSSLPENFTRPAGTGRRPCSQCSSCWRSTRTPRSMRWPSRSSCMGTNAPHTTAFPAIG